MDFMGLFAQKINLTVEICGDLHYYIKDELNLAVGYVPTALKRVFKDPQDYTPGGNVCSRL